MTTTSTGPQGPVAGLICPSHGRVDIDYPEYRAQLARPHTGWICPHCGAISDFDDDRYEELNFID